MSFVVLSLPRSRSYWLSRFLAYGGWTCGHEELRHLRSLADLRSWWAIPANGSCETAGAPFWRLIPEDVRILLVRRPVSQVKSSLLARAQFDSGILDRQLKYLDHKLDQVRSRRDCLEIEYADLQSEVVGGIVFKYCLDMKLPHEWWAALSPLNFQIDLPGLLRHFQAHRPQLDLMTARAKAEMLRGLGPRKSYRTADLDGVVIEEVSVLELYTKGQVLMAEHCEAVGEDSDNYVNKNWPLMQQLEAMGLHQIMMGSINGRPMGYLGTIISPSLEDRDRTIGVHHGFFVSPDAPPGLGARLRRAAGEALGSKGVNEIVLTAATRGDGPRLAKIYERLGAKFFGQIYKQQLGDRTWA